MKTVVNKLMYPGALKVSPWREKRRFGRLFGKARSWKRQNRGAFARIMCYKGRNRVARFRIMKLWPMHLHQYMPMI